MACDTDIKLSFPQSRVYLDAGENAEGECVMEFRLIYEGELLSSGNRGSTADNKHAIRKALHPQLRRLWQVHRGIQQYALMRSNLVQLTPEATDMERISAGIKVISEQWERAGIRFVPLVTPLYALRCNLDILLLRPADERFIFRRGDMDGQVKTLFDALRIPESADETGSSGPGEDEAPFYCLLSDDRLITGMQVTDDQLLVLPRQREVKGTDAFVVIHVQISHRYGGAMDRFFD